MKYFLRFLLAFIGTVAVYYTIFTYINYAFIGFGVVRALGVAICAVIFYLAIRDNPWIIRLSNKLKMNRIEQRGILSMAAILAISQMILAEEVSDLYNHSLLDQASVPVEAIVIDCEDGYCVCEYHAGDRTFQQKIKDSHEGFESGSSVEIHYLKHNPNIFRLAVATTSRTSTP